MLEKEIFKIIIDFFNKNDKPKIIIGLCTTSTKGNKNLNYLSAPRKIKNNMFYFHLILNDNQIALSLADKLNKITNYFFIDTEIKNKSFNWKNIVENLLKKKKTFQFFKIEPNYLTINKILSLINLDPLLSILIIGHGNIAFGLGNRLENSGFDFNWVKTHNNKSKSYIKMRDNFQNRELSILDNQFDIIINTVPVETNINLNSLIKNETLLIEVSNKSLDYISFVKCKKIKIDVTLEISSFINYSFKTKTNYERIGRRKIKNLIICSGGIFGELGDIVVDDYKKPKYTIGIADGKGGFKSRFIKPFKEYLSEKVI